MDNKLFKLMHKDVEVCNLALDTASGQIVEVGAINNHKFLPIINLEQNTTYINYKQELSNWWSRRAIPMTRKGMPAALSILNKQNTGQLLIDNLGLSLSDHYWIKPFGEKYTWADVNLYENSFTDAFGDFQFTNNKENLLDLCHKTTFTPSASLQGELKKKWVIDKKNRRILIKGNYDGNIQQSINEVFISNIHKKQANFHYTPYNYIKINTDNNYTTGCACENFTNMSLEFVPAIDVCAAHHQPNDKSTFEHFVNICEENGLNPKYVSDFLQYQIIIDFITTNTDRHFNNFGILRDSNTLQYKMMAPIFDNGNAMLWNQTNIPNNYLDISISSFTKKEVDLFKYITNKDLVDINKLPSTEDIYKEYSKDVNMSEYKKQIIIDTYNNKCALYEMFLNGLDMKKEAFETRKNPKIYSISNMAENKNNSSNMMLDENDNYDDFEL